MAGTLVLMFVCTNLTPDLLSQLISRSIFTIFATMFSHSIFSSFDTNFIKNAMKITLMKSSLRTMSYQLNSNMLPVQ